MTALAVYSARNSHIFEFFLVLAIDHLEIITGRFLHTD
jgi:hypothetical protein